MPETLNPSQVSGIKKGRNKRPISIGSVLFQKLYGQPRLLPLLPIGTPMV